MQNGLSSMTFLQNDQLGNARSGIPRKFEDFFAKWPKFKDFFAKCPGTFLQNGLSSRTFLQNDRGLFCKVA